MTQRHFDFVERNVTEPLLRNETLGKCGGPKHNGKESANDSVFEFEKKRLRPQKYDRETMMKTLTAMQRVQEIRMDRAKRFYKKRMDKVKDDKTAYKRKMIEKHIGLVISKNAVRNKAELKNLALELIKKRRKKENREGLDHRGRKMVKL